MKQNKLILIVDDEATNLRVIGNLLGTSYQVAVANNGQKALELAQQEPQPDLILLDIMMPDIDGYQVCKQLKNESNTAHIPIIFLTAKDEDKDEAKGLELGAVDFITKPFRPIVDLKRIALQLELNQPTIYRSDDKPLQVESHLMELYHLTLTEARLCNHLINGEVLEQAAEKMGLKYSTTRTYLRTIFEKTETNKQHELVAVLLKNFIR